MNKRKQKQISRILAAKRAEKCGQIDFDSEIQYLKDYVEELYIVFGKVKHSLKIQCDINNYFSKIINRLEDDVIKHKKEKIDSLLLGLASGMIGGIIGMFMWVLCIL
jgi:hypothetical protein